MTKIYMHDSKYAIENGERKQFFDSRSENLRCKYAIEDTIKENFDGAHLNPQCVEKVLDDFGWERTRAVIGCSVRKLYWDGRFSKTNKKWAAEIAAQYQETQLLEQDPVESHPVVLNEFINLCRKAKGE